MEGVREFFRVRVGGRRVIGEEASWCFRLLEFSLVFSRRAVFL